ncbi:hypothetical protein LIER_28641 [Lithospermum erythrorhizon]|uniref:Uncharacterized protein n=1 Tax=Lithospermum erythrorhizon TaxID=34254 RepID=A0AAV3RGF4_LITER
MVFFCCSTKFVLILLLLSAIPIGYIIHLETQKSTTNISYHSNGWMRECTKWDSDNNRFLVSFFEGGLGEISLSENESHLEEKIVVKDVDLSGNATLGLAIDRQRNRVVVVVADALGNKYSSVVAYDLTTWERLFLTKLSGPGNKSWS